MARADTITLLSLDRWAEIIGINPAHFNGAAGDTILPAQGSCGDVWFQYAWQAGERIAREEIAIEIAKAEADIMSLVNYPLAPIWIAEEVQKWPRHHRRNRIGRQLNVQALPLSVTTRFGKVISGGRRASSLIEADATITFSDADGDGYDETATITVATTVTEESEVKVYFKDNGAAPEWEVRHPRTITISGGNAVLTFWAWQLIQPALWNKFPTIDGTAALVITDAIYESEVDVYRVYNDETAIASEFYWPGEYGQSLFCSNCGGAGCESCDMQTQTGCLTVRNAERGFVVPHTATYDADDAEWDEDDWAVCGEPDYVKLWYRAGLLSDEYLRGFALDPLSNQWAKLIAYMALSRLDKPFCGCKHVMSIQRKYQRDLAFSSAEGGSYFLSDADQRSPFGTRLGEVEAWRYVRDMAPKRGKVAVI